jgi:voltage-gated potassium channel Kch
MIRRHLGRGILKPGLVVAGAAIVIGAGAGAAFETETVGSYGRGLWWAVSLMTTVGFIGAPPRTTAGAVVSVILMLIGFLLLSLLSAALASMFVREDVAPVEERELVADAEIAHRLDSIAARLERLEATLKRLDEHSSTVDGAAPQLEAPRT